MSRRNSKLARSFQEDQPLAEQDKGALRRELVPAMLALSKPSEAPIRIQVAEAVSLIAELDFPDKWPDLIDVR
jgi:exportin-2 (importin alpha re-exporter)